MLCEIPISCDYLNIKITPYRKYLFMIIVGIKIKYKATFNSKTKYVKTLYPLVCEKLTIILLAIIFKNSTSNQFNQLNLTHFITAVYINTIILNLHLNSMKFL